MPKKSARYAIGDIHGRPDELVRVLRLIESDAAANGIRKPRVWLLGDYVDRGYDSKGVLDILTSEEFASAFDATFILGNHEVMMIVAEDDDEVADGWTDVGGLQTIWSYGVETQQRLMRDYLDEFYAKLPKAHRKFLEGLEMFDVADDLFFVHAGIAPDLPPRAQTYEAMVWGDRRFVTGVWSWDYRVVHGHWATPKVVTRPNRVCVDTGCGFKDGYLSAVAIQGSDVRVL